MKTCKKCNEIKELDLFKKDNRNKDGRSERCKKCAVQDCLVSQKLHLDKYKAYQKAYTNTDKERQRKAAYKRTHPELRSAYEAKHRATLLNQTPKWADLKTIKEFYLKRPKGYHVDHIIPLKGKNVSGLHVLNNLQYLPASENCSKGNRVKVGC